MFNKMKCFRRMSAFLAIAAVSLSLSATNIPSNITPQQLEQFKRLSPSQQQALASSMGIDFKSLQRQLSNSSSQDAYQTNEELQQLFERGTEFDEFGNPIEDPEKKKAEDEDKELKPFGYEIFANQPNTFAPSLDTLVPDNYSLASGDTLVVHIYGKNNSRHEVTLDREGLLIIPELGAFNVAGMSYGEAKLFIKNEIKNKVLGVEIAISISQLRTIRVFVLGDAYKPGQYVVNSLSTVTHALISAGGISEIGSLRQIQLKRAGKLVQTIDLYDLLIKGDSSSDVTLRSGDVVFVGSVGDQVHVSGEVKRPAIYELTSNETYGDVLKLAGGLKPSAFGAATTIERFNKNSFRTIENIDLTKKSSLDLLARAGDKINVRETSAEVQEAVTLIGAVSRPGKYQWKENQRISDLVPSVHGYLLPGADLSYGVVVREKDKARNIEVLQFSFYNIVSDPTSEENFVLSPKDKVLFFSVYTKKVKNAAELDNLAMTEQELVEQEKELAQKIYEDKSFWLKYGDVERASMESSDTESNIELAEKTLEELTGGKLEEDIAFVELHPFSRKRLLLPVIEKLKQQAAAGQPLQLIEAVGAVKFPGIYPLSQNMSVANLVSASGGLLESAFLNKAEITRSGLNGDQAFKKAFNIHLGKALIGNTEDNTLLKSKDRLNVLTVPSWQENHIVELRGEFRFPGKYTIQRGETLAQLIERVGGYTEYAYLEGSVFTRVKLKQLEMQNLIKVSDSLRMEIASKSLAQNKGANYIDYNQAKLLLSDLTKVKPVGRLVVDLPKIGADAGQDLLLENGDVLYVPTKQNSVNVIGQVQVATSHIYQSGFDAFDYVNLSGGVKQQADFERIYVIKANGSVAIPQTASWFNEGADIALEPGDTVVVPLDSEYMDNLTLWATGTQIVYQAAVAIAAIAGI